HGEVRSDTDDFLPRSRRHRVGPRGRPHRGGADAPAKWAVATEQLLRERAVHDHRGRRRGEIAGFERAAGDHVDIEGVEIAKIDARDAHDGVYVPSAAVLRRW